MSIKVKIIEITDLATKADRYIDIVFRGVPHLTQVFKGCKGDVTFNEEFTWPLSSPIMADEILELYLYSKSVIFSDKMVAAYRCNLSWFGDESVFEITDYLVDAQDRPIPSQVTLELTYKRPEKSASAEIRIDLEEVDDVVDPGGVILSNQFLDLPLSVTKKAAPSIISSSATSPTDKFGSGHHDDRTDITDCLGGKEAFHPRSPGIRLPRSYCAKYCEWQVQVKIIEGKGLNGMAIDPFVEISVGDQRKHTTTKPHNNNPSWEEYFVFEFKLPKEQLLDQVVLFQVLTGRSLVSQGTMIGQFKMDLWTVYGQKDHSFFSKWAVLLGPEPTEVKGYLLVDVSVFGKGEHIKIPAQKQEVDIEKNLLLPPGIQALRSVAKYSVKIYAAKGIPRMITNLMANVKKAITGKVKDLADPYVEVSFAGCKEKTKTVRSSYEPEFNQEIIFWEFLTPMCRRIKIQLRDGDEAIGTHFVDLDAISEMEGGCGREGFMPTFGPCWVHLYGSTRDYSYFKENNELNSGIGEGISYRGRVLIEIVTHEYEPCETGVVEVRDFNPTASKTSRLPRELDFQLFSTFYEGSMIDKKAGERPVQFEMSIGEYGYHSEDMSPTDTKSRRSSKTEGEIGLLASSPTEDSEYFTITRPLMPVDQSRRYSAMRWDDVKPCLSLQFTMGDERIRHFYQSIILRHYCRLEDNLAELEERIKLDLSGTKSVLKRVLQELIHGCSILVRTADERFTASDLRNELDRNRSEQRTSDMAAISKEAAEMLKNLSCDQERIQENVEMMRKCFLKRMETLLLEPHHGFPDIFIWMLSGGKRVAYARIPAVDVLYSEKDHERGLHCGSLQTLFMKPVGKRATSGTQWNIQAKVRLMVWLGLERERQNILRFAPKGFTVEDDLPRSIQYKESSKFILRAHIYQARSLFGSDDTGLSDALARVIYGNKVKETRVIWETRSPTWDQMLKFKNVTLWGAVEEFCCAPPMVVIEIYDKDKNGEMEFIGRSLAMPVVKLAHQSYDKPFFPPLLQWFPIWRGDDKAGDLLAAFELLQDCEDDLSLPYDPEPFANGVVSIPPEIKPTTKKYIVEVFFFGVREMKRVKYLQVTRPRVDLDCCYKVRAINVKTGQNNGKWQQSISSTICKNAKMNPNFENSIVVFEVELPEERYIPPVTIRVTDCRAFGRHILAGSYVINSLQKYILNPINYEKMIETENGGFSKRCSEATMSNGHTNKRVSIPPVVIAASVKDKVVKKTQKKREEVIDWWTRLHVTMRDSDSEVAEHSTKCGKSKESSVPKLMIYPCELEKVKEFRGFTDAVETYPLTKGKQFENDDDYDDPDVKRFSGKFKGCIRIWKAESLPARYSEAGNFKTTFKEHRLPKYDPVKMLIRVYVVKGSDLKPADTNGKADPYLIVTLGRHKVNDKKNLVSRQLNPEFGRMFQFEAELPFDNLLTIQVHDWDFVSFDDFIGETKIDIENRYYSKHRPTCGLPLSYDVSGCSKWRDSMKPTQILSNLCKREYLPRPVYKDGACEIGPKKFVPKKHLNDDRVSPIQSEEQAALYTLRHFHELENGYHLVPEHIETRMLYRPDKPGIKQGSLEMWVDMFPMEGPAPGPPVDIAPRKPEEFELRVIVWSTDDVPAADTNLFTGIPSSDIYVKGWLEGQIDDIQKTDVHYRSTDGNGMFNWRFVFPFLFHRAKEKFVRMKKSSIIGFDEWEETQDPKLHLEILDADVFSSDDMIGKLELNITKVPPPMKASKLCKLEMLECKANLTSLIQNGAMRGWWAITGYDDDGLVKQKGEIELEFELLKQDEAAANPAGRGRDEPHPLAKPHRPADSLNLFMSPLRMVQLLLCSHKKCIVKFMIVSLLIILMVLFFYSMPGYTVKRLFGA